MQDIEKRNVNCIIVKDLYSVTKDAEIKKIKLLLKTGDQIAILAADNDSILIAKNGDKDNPYFVSADFLMACSDYKGK